MLSIFRDVNDDPSWFEESTLYELYDQRIPLTEIFSLLTCDKEWSHMATKKQTKKIFELFDKVYGYTKGRSRLEE